MARDRAARPEARPLRLFVAVDVPDAIKEDLVRGVDAFRSKIPGARWTNPPSWHVTLKFLGATWPRLVEEVKAAVADVARSGPPFETALTEFGAFPSPVRARVVWAGLSDPERRFGSLARSLDEALSERFAAENRSFTPHLTVARLAPPRDLRMVAPDLVGAPLGSEGFPVDRLVIYRSHLSPKGARYEALESFRLAG